jgi:hypothetical protein
VKNPDIEQMTLGNMRAAGVGSLLFTCLQCHHEMIIDGRGWLDLVRLASLGPMVVCTKCRTVGADARPNWRERRWQVAASRVGNLQDEA